MNLELFAQMRALQAAYTSTNQGFVEHMLREDERGGGMLRQDLKLKRIQFDAPEALAQDLEAVCELLECSKRQFLEGAVFEAIGKAQASYRRTLEAAAVVDGPQYTLTMDSEG